MIRDCMGFLLAIGLVSLGANTTHAGVLDDASEAADYTLVYELKIPNLADFNVAAVPYTTDLTDTIDFTFDRVAYHLELQRPGEDRVFVYVSVPSPVLTPKETGVPHAATGVNLQHLVEDMHVVSNHPNLASLGDIDTGSIEFWPSNYGVANAMGVPGANPDFYDTGDQSLGGAGYGSMQVHDYDSGQTLFSYSAWGFGWNDSDLGIGNNPDTNPEANPDWTFAANASSYTTKNLSVLVRPGDAPVGLSVDMLSPQPYQVVQRQEGNVATLQLAGTLKITCDLIEARLSPLALDGSDAGSPTDWQVVENAPSGSSFYGHLEASAGWYRLELQLSAYGAVLDTVRVSPVGIGEVFITAGQSNAANHGEAPISPADPRVSAWGTGGWQHAVDPQPIATGTGGSPWPTLGDLLAQRFGVPIGFISVAWGATAVDQWRPYASDALYDRLLLALGTVGHKGARAVLWHQGESDAVAETATEDYASQLQEVIDATRQDAGWDLPWGVAIAAYLPGLESGPMQAVLDGQQSVIDSDSLTFQGPATDDLSGPDWRWDEVHLNHAGLVEHAKRWDALITLPPCQGFEVDEDCREPPTEQSSPDAGGMSDAGGTPDAGATEDLVVPRDISASLETKAEVGPDEPDAVTAVIEEERRRLENLSTEEDAGSETPSVSAKSSGCKGAPGSPSPAWPQAVWLLGLFLYSSRRAEAQGRAIIRCSRIETRHRDPGEGLRC